jgi:hypothetical protein
VVIAGGRYRHPATYLRRSAPQAIEHREDLSKAGFGEPVDREATVVADRHKPGVPESTQVVSQPRRSYAQQLTQFTG